MESRGATPLYLTKNNGKLPEYVEANYKVDGPTAAQALHDLKAPIIDSPTSPPDKNDDVAVLE